MLRPILFLRPHAAGIEFHAGHVTNLAQDTVDYLARQLTVRVRKPEVSFYGDRAVKKQAGAKLRDIVEVGHHAAGTAGLLVLPANVHCIRTKHPGCNTPVDHTVGYRQGFGKALPRSRRATPTTRAASSVFRWVSKAAMASSCFRPNFAPCPVIWEQLRTSALDLTSRFRPVGSGLPSQDASDYRRNRESDSPYSTIPHPVLG